jgi:hypothetical protein
VAARVHGDGDLGDAQPRVAQEEEHADVLVIEQGGFFGREQAAGRRIVVAEARSEVVEVETGQHAEVRPGDAAQPAAAAGTRGDHHVGAA